MSSAYCRFAPGDPTHGGYHDTEYGFPTEDESVLFERLMLEINQAGLSWATILKKRAAFRAAYARSSGSPPLARWRSNGCLPIRASSATGSRLRPLRRMPGGFRRYGDRTGRLPFGLQLIIRVRQRRGPSSSAGRFALPAGRLSANF
jgi:hypothetical protein